MATNPPPDPDDSGNEYRLGEFYFETNNATHIQQFCLALEDAGFETVTTWDDDGCYVEVLWRDRVVE